MPTHTHLVDPGRNKLWLRRGRRELRTWRITLVTHDNYACESDKVDLRDRNPAMMHLVLHHNGVDSVGSVMDIL